MFNYGTVRLFFLKVVFGIILLSLSFFIFGSLLSHNILDPGFNVNNSQQNINNYFGYSGAIFSSYILAFIGHCSYIYSLFLFLEGSKHLLGIKTKLFILRFFFLFFGLVLVDSFISIYDINYYKIGLFPLILSDLTYNIFFKNFDSLITYNALWFAIFLIGIFFILFSFKIKLRNYFRILYIFYPLKYFLKFSPFAFLKSLKNLFTYKTKKGLNSTRNEPTISFSNKKFENSKVNQNGSNEISKNLYSFILPNSSLLIKSSRQDLLNKELDKINKLSSVKLEKTLLEYGIEGKIIGFKCGPIVTLFEFVPKAGIKASKIIGLADDIARAMSSFSARISSQPGKTSLGIEIPNAKRENVYFGDIVEDERFKLSSNNLKLALGKNISGEKVYADLEKMPHLLIAGTTGSGKSVGINTMILSLLFRFKPNECKLILIDPKMLELSVYEDIPHLLTPVVTNPNKAVFALKWVVKEMENRYKLMSSINVKNIQTYNEKVNKTLSTGRKLYREVQTGVDNEKKVPIIEKREIPLENMPLIVVVIDEMADLMMVAGKEVESLVQRLAQMARASGIHLITATQRPSVDVITGTIKANFPSRISYKVASKFDSRTILNEMGAEQLLGSGDMLFLENGSTITRLHGGFVSENEVEKIVNHIKNQSKFDPNKEISLLDNSEKENNGLKLINEEVDELYNKAVNIILEQQKVSTSFIQRYLQIGYNRAARIIEKMEENGVISEANNAGKRQVLKKK